MNQTTLDQLQTCLIQIGNLERTMYSAAETRTAISGLGEDAREVYRLSAIIETCKAEIKDSKKTFNQLLNQLTPYILS